MTESTHLGLRYPEFIYDNYTYQVVGEEIVIKYKFLIPPEIEFSPIISVRFRESQILDNLVFHLGLIEMFSYWKATASPLIIIKAGTLNNQQIIWWHNLLIKGMGEFFYKNRLNFTADNFLTIKNGVSSESSTSGESLRATPDVINKSDKFLVPVGGGKDSALSLNLLQKWGKQVTALVLNPTPAALRVIQASQVKDTIIVNRTIDPSLLELNTQGFYNGHTPFSAYLAFLSLLVARIYQIPQIALSNERSANEGNANYLGQEINHQYSKTYEFEKSFRKYVSAYLSCHYVPPAESEAVPLNMRLPCHPADGGIPRNDTLRMSAINYFSLLRPLYDLQIAQLFSHFPVYHDKIISCNRGAKVGKWCGECPKCVSTFTLLYPFVGEEKLSTIFGTNLFDQQSLWPRLVELIDPSIDRPFECVGTREETLIALYLATQLHQGDKLPELLRLVQEKYLVKETDLESRANRILSSWDQNNFVPEELKVLLKKELLGEVMSLRGAK